MPYAAYNKLYRKGKAVSRRPYRNCTAKTEVDARRKSNQINARWNKLKMNRGFVAKTVAVKKVKR